MTHPNARSIQRIDSSTAELKRMYLVPEERG